MRTENLVVVVLLTVVASVFVAAVRSGAEIQPARVREPTELAAVLGRMSDAARGDPLYDDRVTRMLRAISQSPASGNQLATES